MELVKHPTLADSICDIRSRKIKRTFFTQINTLLDWQPIIKVLKNHYTKGQSAKGKPSYSGLLLFKMSLLQTWYGLSDYEVEDRVNDSISFSYFCGLHIDQVAPDHSTLSRFRSIMTKAKAYESLFKEINKQLEAHKIIVKTGAIVDASVIDTPLKPKGTTNHKVTQDRKDDQEVEVIKDYPDSVDTEAAWLKKGGKYRFGYKKHHLTENTGIDFMTQTLPNKHPENYIIPIGIRIKNKHSYTFSINHNNLPKDLMIFLEDKKKQTIIRIDNKKYTIDLDATDTGVGRFYLRTSTTDLSKTLHATKNSLNQVRIYLTSKENLKITGLNDSNTTVILYNILGKVVLKKQLKINHSADILISSSLKKGIYIIKIQATNRNINKKIILK